MAYFGDTDWDAESPVDSDFVFYEDLGDGRLHRRVYKDENSDQPISSESAPIANAVKLPCGGILTIGRSVDSETARSALKHLGGEAVWVETPEILFWPDGSGEFVHQDFFNQQNKTVFSELPYLCLEVLSGPGVTLETGPLANALIYWGDYSAFPSVDRGFKYRLIEYSDSYPMVGKLWEMIGATVVAGGAV